MSTTTIASLISNVLQRTGLGPGVQAELQKVTAAAGAGKAQSSSGKDDIVTLTHEYRLVAQWVAGSLDTFRDELLPISFALFVHTYITIVKRRPNDAKAFLNEHSNRFAVGHQSELLELERFASWPVDATDGDLAKLHPYVASLQSSKFVVTMTTSSAEMLVSMLLEHRLSAMLELVNQYVEINIPHPKQRFPERRTSMVAAKAARLAKNGGDTLRNDAKASTEVLSGLDQHQVIALNSSTNVDWRVPSSILFGNAAAANKSSKSSSTNSIESTELWKDYYKTMVEKSRTFAESQKKTAIFGDDEARPPRGDGAVKWPHIAMLTFLNAADGLSCATTSPDANVVACGFEDSRVAVWSAKPNETFGRKSTTLIGHGGPVYGISMRSDGDAFVSCSYDATVRLWSTSRGGGGASWACDHVYALPGVVWSVHMAKYGYFFVTGCRDQRVRLHHTASPNTVVREFVGHMSDVNCVEMHPNIHYVASGSDDKTVRLWDVRTGSCVRVFVGHTDGVSSVAVDRDGRHIASGGKDHAVMVWDIATGKLVSSLEGHDSTVTALTWGNDFLASGATDCAVAVWTKDTLHTESPQSRKFITKFTPVVHLNFTKPDVLIAAGSLGLL